MIRFTLSSIALAVAAAATGCAALETAAVPAAPPDAAAAPTPLVEEHKLFERFAGKWDAEVEMASQEPGGAPEKSKAKSVSHLACGGLWLVTDFEGTMMGQPFTGHEVMGYDAAQKKYTSSWVDSWTPTVMTGTGAFDAATNTFRSEMAGVDATGAPSAHRGTDVWSDNDHHTWTMLMKAPDGSEFPAMTIRYSRRK